MCESAPLETPTLEKIRSADQQRLWPLLSLQPRCCSVHGHRLGRHMNTQEIVLCSSGASASSQGLGAITVHNFQTGTLLASFKQTCADVHSTAVPPTRNGEGGFVVAAQPDKSIVNAYYFQKVGAWLSLLVQLLISSTGPNRFENGTP